MNTKKNDDLSEREEEMQPLYDFSGGVRGKYYQAYQQGYRVLIHKTDGTTAVQAFMLPEGAILLDPDYAPISQMQRRSIMPCGS